MDNYVIQNLNEMKVNYEEKDILAVFQKETLNRFKVIKVAFFDFQ